MYNLKATLLSVCYCSLAVTATPFFQNKGTTDLASDVGSFSGWDGFNHEDKGTVTEVTNVYYEAGTGLKMEQIYDASWSGRFHSEAIKKNVYTVGDSGFYGFTFRLHSNWDTSSTQTFNVAQTIANLEDNENNTCGDDWIPSMSQFKPPDQTTPNNY